MNRYSFLIYWLVLLLSCGSCDSTNRGVELSLIESGANRSELKKVLDHYSASEKDSLKLRAAKFLISNMRYKYSVAGERAEEYDTFLKGAFEIEREAYIDSQFYAPYLQNSLYATSDVSFIKDVEVIKADYLINNIEQAFGVWEKPWAKHLDFEMFSELILPYRIGNEPLEDWRTMYSHRFSDLVADSDTTTALMACKLINDTLIKYPIHIANSSYSPGNIRPSTLIDISFGLCSDYSNLAIYAMRSLGIPVSELWIPRFAKRPNSHMFNMVVNNDNIVHDFSGAENNPDEHLVRFDGIAKVYRKTFGLQHKSLPMVCGNEDIPVHLNNPFLKDETGSFSFLNPKDIKINIPKLSIKNKIVYISVFDINGWYPVDWSVVSDNMAEFKNIGTGNVYCITYYENNKNITMGFPFEVKDNGDVHYFIPDETKKEQIRLKRKYPYAQGLLKVPNSIVGGEFQGANSLDFQDSKTLHSITIAPDFEYTTVNVNENVREYKYYRYIASDSSRVSMAEIEFYDADNGEILQGEVIGTKEISPYTPTAFPEKAFDQDPLTFVFTKETRGMVGLKLDTPKKVDKIRYLIRNGDNGIRKGQNYELFYATDNGWTSLGQQIAMQDNFIDYDKVPKGGLYWLRNLTKGKEERIFIIDVNGNQIWY